MIIIIAVNFTNLFDIVVTIVIIIVIDIDFIMVISDLINNEYFLDSIFIIVIIINRKINFKIKPKYYNFKFLIDPSYSLY